MNSGDVGKWNMAVGLWVMAAFMVYGFILIYFRDFAPDKEAWIAAYNVSPHFEARLAHVHGNLMSFLNIVFGFILVKVPMPVDRAKWVSWLALTGLLMPIGILAEVYLGMPFYPVLIGGLSILSATVLLGWSMVKLKLNPR